MTIHIPDSDQTTACTIMNFFYGANENHQVNNQTISEISVGSGTYHIIPPPSFDRLWALSTKNLFVADDATNQQFHEVFTVEPISSVLTLLTDPPFPAAIRVSYRYYPNHAAVKVFEVKQTWPEPINNPDAFGQQVFPLQDKFPIKIEWKVYGIDIDIVKIIMRTGIKKNNFFLMIDDNITEASFRSSTPGLMRPGWAAEGPIFADEIDLVDRGGELFPRFSMQPHQYGDYFFHTTVTPTDKWWTTTTFTYFNALVTPSVPYAWPPPDWWTFSSGTNLVFSGTGTNDMTVGSDSNYTGTDPHKSYLVQITLGDPTSPNQFQWSDDGGITFTGPLPILDLSPLTIGLNDGVTIEFPVATGHDTSDFWTFEVFNWSPLLLPPLGTPPGGFIVWDSNLPEP